MEAVLTIAVLCLSASTAVLAASVPFLYWKCFRLEWEYRQEVKELSRRIDVLDEALDQLLERVGVSAEGE